MFLPAIWKLPLLKQTWRRDDKTKVDLIVSMLGERENSPLVSCTLIIFWLWLTVKNRLPYHNNLKTIICGLYGRSFHVNMQAEAGFVSLITFYETRLKLLSSCSLALLGDFITAV